MQALQQYLIAERWFFLCSMLFACGSCAYIAPENHERLKFEIHDLARSGIEADDAVRNLKTHEFLCHDGSIYEVSVKTKFIECTRSRSSPLLYACIHRIWLYPQEHGDILTKVEVFIPACTGV